MTLIATLSTWTTCVFTTRACRSKRRLTLQAAATPASAKSARWIRRARFCSWHSGNCADEPLQFHCLNESVIIVTTCYRKKLGELDGIQRHLNRKLSANAVQSVNQDDCSAKNEQQGEHDLLQLMLQSRQLVGEVSSVISSELQFIVLDVTVKKRHYSL